MMLFVLHNEKTRNRHSRLYTEIVVALAANDEIQTQNLIDLKNVLYELFIEFRLYLYKIGSKLSDADIDFLHFNPGRY